MSEETYSTQRLDHLGIVAGICQQISLVAIFPEEAAMNFL
jgi:hypothetical protein